MAGTDGSVMQPIGECERPDEMETLCMNCNEEGTTRILLTKIPHFREIILMAFECPHCHWRNTEVQFGGAYQEHGVHIELNVTKEEDMSRQVVKSDAATFGVPALEFEIPANSQRGQLSTIEGLLTRAVDGLIGNLPLYQAVDPEKAGQVQEFVEKLQPYARGKVFPFKVVLDDPGGNSYIESPFAPEPDPEMTTRHYVRTPEQDEDLGFRSPTSLAEPSAGGGGASSTAGGGASSTSAAAASLLSQEQSEALFNRTVGQEDGPPNDVVEMPENCPSCQEPGSVKMLVTDIPHFKQIVLMAFNCERCGFKSNEVKPGGPVSAKGKRYILRMENFPLDLNRDLLKSHTAGFAIPELKLELTPGTLGGRFTTVEGLMQEVKKDLQENRFVFGDSCQPERVERMQRFFQHLDALLEGEMPFTVVLDDPLANSYIQNVYAPDEDPKMVVEEYERTAEQEDELGIKDMVTENYY